MSHTPRVEFSSPFQLTRGSPGSAGVDLLSIVDVDIAPGQHAIVDTGTQLFHVDEGYYIQLAPRSGLAANYGIQVLAGVIDGDFRGCIKAILFNSGRRKTLQIKKGDRICQAIVLPYGHGPNITCNSEPVDSVKETRGSGGFGSTGL